MLYVLLKKIFFVPSLEIISYKSPSSSQQKKQENFCNKYDKSVFTIIHRQAIQTRKNLILSKNMETLLELKQKMLLSPIP